MRFGEFQPAKGDNFHPAWIFSVWRVYPGLKLSSKSGVKPCDNLFYDICDPLPFIDSNFTFMKDFSYITNSHPAFIESLYQDFVKNPESVDPELKKFFEGFDFAFSSFKNGSTHSGNGAPASAPAK